MSLSKSLNSEKARIFRICHVENLPWILDNGLSCRNADAFNPNFVSIGNAELINKRARRAVPVAPYGVLSDYIPFYFTPYSIMLYNVTTGYGGVKKVPNANIVLLVSSVHEVEKRGIPFCFTSGHAYPAYADYYNSTADLDQIDWALLQRRDFSLDANDPGKKDRYQAEALVHHHLPLEGLLGMACYDEEVKKWIESELQARSIEMKVLALPRYYF